MAGWADTKLMKLRTETYCLSLQQYTNYPPTGTLLLSDAGGTDECIRFKDTAVFAEFACQLTT